MYMCVCMFVYEYEGVHERVRVCALGTCVRMSVCGCVHVHVCVQGCLYECMCVCVHVRV